MGGQLGRYKGQISQGFECQSNGSEVSLKLSM